MRLQQLDTELRNRGLKLTFREKQSLLSQSGPISEVLERYLNPPQAPQLPELQNGGFTPASSTRVSMPPMLPLEQMVQDNERVRRIEENQRLASQLPNELKYQGPVPDNEKIDYRYTDRRSSNYVGNPDMAFMAPGKTGQMRADAETYHNTIIGEELAGLGIGAGISKGISALKRLKNISKPVTSFADNTATTFNSEINWSKWNPETPKKQDLMDEYLQIERKAKEDNTWMKNSDGSAFQGTPEQFVQERSSWYKKAYGSEGPEIFYRGVTPKTSGLDPTKRAGFEGDRVLFGGDFNTAKEYTWGHPYIVKPKEGAQGVYELMYPKSKKIMTTDAGGSDWADLDLLPDQTGLINTIESTVALKNKMMSDPALRKYVENTQHRIDRLNKTKTTIANMPANTRMHLENLQQMHPQGVTTDDVAKYIEQQKLDGIRINDVLDGPMGNISLINNTKGSYIKSKVGNIGYFDLDDPDILKAIGYPVSAATGLETYRRTMDREE